MFGLTYIGLIGIAIGLYMFYKVFNPLVVAWQYKLKYKELVVVKFWPLLGAFGYVFLGEVLGDSQKWIRNIVRENPKAKIIMTNFCFQPQLMIIDGAYAKEMLSVHTHKFEWTDLLFGSELFMDQGLVATMGKKWKQQRSMLGKVFHFDALKRRVPVIKQIAQEKIDSLKRSSDGKTPIKVISTSQNMTGEVVVQTFFGKNFTQAVHMGLNVNDTVTTFVKDCAMVSMDPYFSLKRILLGKKFGTYFMQSKKEKNAMKKVNMMRDLAFSLIEERIQVFDANKSDEKKDFLDYYLQDFLNNNPEDNKITKEEIVQQFITLYFAGMDTTANLTGKTLYFIAQYPEIYAKIQKEVDSVIPDINNLQPEDLNKLPITTAFLKEILRYVTPSYILGFRSVTQAFRLGNEIDIPKGMVVDISFHAIHRNPLNFENPDEFDINRFLDNKEISPYYIPFGAGARNCIGQHLSQIEAKVFLAYFIKNYNLHFDQKKAPLKMGGVLLYQPLDEELITLTERKH